MDGIYNDKGAHFTSENSGQIRIGQNDGNIGRHGILGLDIGAIFTNDNATVEIDNVTQNGIQNVTGSNITNQNAGQILIGQNSGNIGVNGIINGSATTTFTNDNAIIEIDNVTQDGIQNVESGHFINENSGQILIGQNEGNIERIGILGFEGAIFTNNNATIEIDNVVFDGIENILGSHFANENFGQILIGQNGGNIGRIGILNFGANTPFTNTNATIEIDDVNENSIRNLATFNNTGCTSLIHILSKGIFNDNIFNNEGIIIEESMGNSLISNNTGVIQNLNGGNFTVDTGNEPITFEGHLWAGCTDSDWNNADNWLFNMVPTSTEIVAIPDLANDPIIGGSTAAIVKSVTIGAGAELTIQVGGSLAIDGAINEAMFNNGTVTNSGTISIGINSPIGLDGIENENTFTNEPTGILDIQNVGQRGIINVSTATLFENKGMIEIDETGQSSIVGDGIFVASPFTNTGQIHIGQNGGNIGRRGIFNAGLNATFTNNNGTIEIDNMNSNSIRNSATFNNQGCAALIHVFSQGIFNDNIFNNEGIIIEESVGNSLISNNTGVIQNLNGGNFTVDTGNEPITFEGHLWTGCTDSDWNNADNWLFNMVPTSTENVAIPVMENNPIIGDSTAAIAKSVTIGAGGELTIQVGGNLAIDGAVNEAIFSIGTVTNSGTISIGINSPIGSDGIQNESTFTNESTGILDIQNTGQRGILNGSSATLFENKGLIEIEDTGQSNSSVGEGIYSGSPFVNETCAELEINGVLRNTNTFTNNGLVVFNTADAHTNIGTFTNEGILHHIQDNPIPNVTNNEIIVQPTTVTGCEIMSPIFGLGSSIDFDIMGIFTDASTNNSAGSFVTATNTFTANPILTEGLHSFFVEIEDPTNGCTRILPWDLTTVMCSILPIELLSFEARLTNQNEVKLDWITASEINNDFFTLERSKDGLHFSEIAKIDGAGTSSAILSYSHLDRNPYLGGNYYRLKQTDFDGGFSYSEIRFVNIVSETIAVYPNPTRNFLNVDFGNREDGEVQFKIMDVTGKCFFKGNKEVKNGRLKINLSNLNIHTSGTYFLELRSERNVPQSMIFVKTD